MSQYHDAQQDAQYDTLPPEFQSRIDGFRQSSSLFRKEFEPYEMFVCEQAVLFANALRTKEAVIAFYNSTSKQQAEQIPGLSPDHNGNTFGRACSLAALYLDRPDLVDKQHGALCPLVGCAKYGCYASRPKDNAVAQEEL